MFGGASETGPILYEASGNEAVTVPLEGNPTGSVVAIERIPGSQLLAIGIQGDDGSLTMQVLAR